MAIIASEITLSLTFFQLPSGRVLVNMTRTTDSPESVTSLLKLVDDPEKLPQCCQVSSSSLRT